MEIAIFLDFDGTTLPLHYENFLKQMSIVSKGKSIGKDKFGYFFSPEVMDNIKVLVDKFNPDIIITSTWKDDLKYLGLSNMWKDRGYAGKLYDVTKPININKRGLEIKEYLKNNEYDKYIIIDDMGVEFFESEQIPYLVQCDPNFGFDKEKLKEAIKLLS